MQVARNCPGISHLLFADDVLLFCHASDNQMQVVSSVLQDFSKASGLKVSVRKSRMMCSPGVSRQRRTILTSISSIPCTSDLGRYLGFSLLHRAHKRSDFQFIISNISQRITSWKARLLNKAGRLCLAKSVLTSLPVYTMQLMWLP